MKIPFAPEGRGIPECRQKFWKTNMQVWKLGLLTCTTWFSQTVTDSPETLAWQFMLLCEVHLDGSTPRLFIYNEWKEKFWNILSQDVRPACPNPAAWGDRAAYRISDDTAPQWCAWGRGESAAGVLQFPGEFPRKPAAGVWERGRGRGRNARILASGAVSEAAVILPTAPASDTRGNPD